VKTFLYLFYQSAKIIVRAVRWVYYSESVIVNRELTKIKGPCIIVSNHPGTLMDPINAVVNMDRIVNFLANASLFSNRFGNWFFSTFYCIKIERYVDTGGKPLDNVAAFRQATDFLTRGGCLYIAPEGGSFEGRHIHELKTGLARIALNTEQENNFELGLKILPVGLVYSDPTKFRRPILINMTEPFLVSGFKKDWEKDRREAVRELTRHLQDRLSEAVLDTTDPEQDCLLAQLELMSQNEEKLPLAQQFDRSKNVLNRMQKLQQQEPAAYGGFAERVNVYAVKLEGLGIEDASVKESPAGQSLLNVGLLVLSPLAMIGYATHFLPAYLTKKLSDKLSSEPVWEPTYKICGGLVIYPAVLFLQFHLLCYWFSTFGEMGNYLKWLYILAIVPTGLIAEWFIENWKLKRSNKRSSRFRKKNKPDWEKLVQERKDILQFTQIG